MVRKSRKGREEWKTYKNVFDKSTEENIWKLSTQGYFSQMESPIALGKEANIFTARKRDGELVVVKIYRLENCNFNKMYSYISADPRFLAIKNSRRKVIFSWVQREYRNLLLARQKIKVPTPYAFKDNILVMEFIGKEEPAPKLKDLLPKDPQKFMAKTLESVKRLIDAQIVHGDLSEFNILNDEEDPVFIDLSQGTTAQAANARFLLERDIRNVTKFFRGRAKFDEEKVVADVLRHFDKSTKTEKL